MIDDALERIAHELAGEDGCCMCIDDDTQRCCMTDRARAILAVVLTEIDKCGLEAGAYTGVLAIFAMKNGIEFEHVRLLADDKRSNVP